MTSSFKWLDHSDTERRKVLDAIDRFKETDTRDELGIARIRDGFSDLFFPGTSVLMTRTRYFLFVPGSSRANPILASPRVAQRCLGGVEPWHMWQTSKTKVLPRATPYGAWSACRKVPPPRGSRWPWRSTARST